MEITYSYDKKRLEFGRQCLFVDYGPNLIDNYPPNRRLVRQYILRDPVNQGVQCSSTQAEHDLNTTRAEYKVAGMNHVEGGWPKDVNINDEESTKRYRRKVEKEESFNHTIIHLCKNVENSILQNNAINIYQHYFADVEVPPVVERSTARTVNVYQDQSGSARPVTHISWSSDSESIVVSHCNLKFQATAQHENYFCYIWDVENPNRPRVTLKPESAVVCMEFNQKDAHALVSGHLSGQVGVWDIRRGSEPVEISILEKSHRDPIHKLRWMNSKSGTEFFSASTDGTIRWWDTRKMTEPTDFLILHYAKEEEQSMAEALGASCLEYEPTIQTRFMVGTEQGIVFSCNRKGKTAMEKMAARFKCHHGPVLALERNPFFLKNFLTIGDWSAKIWSEDCRDSPIIWTPYSRAMLTDGCWSPSRLSVFFTTRSDGILDAWDILQQQTSACLGVKVCDDSLRTIRAHELGRLVAVGSAKGTTYLVEFSENFATSSKNDKTILTSMFERETRREKILEGRLREIKLKQKTAQQAAAPVIGEEGEVLEGGEEDVDVGVFSDKNVIEAEAEFAEIIRTELHIPKPVEEEPEMEVEEQPVEAEEEPPEEPESPPPPPPSTSPPDTKKKKKRKK